MRCRRGAYVAHKGETVIYEGTMRGAGFVRREGRLHWSVRGLSIRM
jgi:hypothetical protein